MKKRGKITAKALDKKFDEGKEDILEHFDVKNAAKRIVLDMPLWMIQELDKEAARLGNSRQALIRSWLARLIDEKQRDEKKQAHG